MPSSYSISGLHVSLGDGSGSHTTGKRWILMALETHFNFRQRHTKHFLSPKRNEIGFPFIGTWKLCSIKFNLHIFPESFQINMKNFEPVNGFAHKILMSCNSVVLFECSI